MALVATCTEVLRLSPKSLRVCLMWCTRAEMSTIIGSDHLQRTAKNSRNDILASAKVTEINNLSSAVKLLKLYIRNKRFTFKAGQWVDMYIPGVDTVGGFSMSSPPHLLAEASLLHLAVKHSQHPPALWVHTKCEVGSTVNLRVGGDFYYAPTPESEPRDLLLIAGGVGINPLFSMLQHFVHCQGAQLHKSVQGRKAHMLYSARSEKDLIFKDDLLNIAQTTGNVKLELFSSREKSGNTDFISNGRIQETHVKSALSTLSLQQTDVYLCGPLPFIEAMKSHCLTSSVPPENVHFERWW